jgi:ubiquinone biosynthesis protein UbiJ
MDNADLGPAMSLHYAEQKAKDGADKVTRLERHVQELEQRLSALEKLLEGARWQR